MRPPLRCLVALAAIALPSLAAADVPALVATEAGVTVDVAPVVVANRDSDDPDAGTGGALRLRVGYRTRFGLEPFAELMPLLGVPAKDGAPGLVAAGVRQGLRLGRVRPHLDVAIASDGDLDRGGPTLGLTAGVDYQLGARLSVGGFVSRYVGGPYDLVVGGVSLGGRF